jgi:proteasome lid subunit RPN8/RPN11
MKPYSSIIIDLDVILSILDFARGSHPREFTCLLEGKVKKMSTQNGKETSKEDRHDNQKEDCLLITGLVYQQYESSENTAVTHLNLPLLHQTVGSVHSHPGPSNKPSMADLQSFNKNGVFHLIIKWPYREEDIAGYDKFGRLALFTAMPLV